MQDIVIYGHYLDPDSNKSAIKRHLRENWENGNTKYEVYIKELMIILGVIMELYCGIH